MESNSIKKPFYIAAITLFATTALLVTKPVVSHADATSRPTVTNINQFDTLSTYQKNVAIFNQQNKDVINTINSSISNDVKDGQRDGFNNISMRKKNRSHDYISAYSNYQMIAQGWIAALNHKPENAVPYLTKNTNAGITKKIADDMNYNIHQAYNGYVDGRAAAQRHNANEPNKEDTYYLASYYKGYNDTAKTYYSSTYNKTPFGTTNKADAQAYYELMHMTSTKTVKKHITKKKVIKKHVKKLKAKKAHKRFPKTVYAKHRTGVHSVPQFNHGKTRYVAKGHKFHVYNKVSDGHGNWRYKVGKHAYITTIPGSIGTHYVKPAHHKR